MNNENPYTPKRITDEDIKFRVPLYQRPYAWGINQVNQLLEDLLTEFKKFKNSRYYIGIITIGNSKNDKHKELIDGQQRITTLLLIGKVLEKKNYNRWNPFTKDRIELYGREDDQHFINNLDKQNVNPNPRMIDAINEINKFIDTNFFSKFESADKFDTFSNFVFEKASFFISSVEEDYTVLDKNRHFIRLNNRGKQLSPPDILKVKLVRIFNKDQHAEAKSFLKIWNGIANNFIYTTVEYTPINKKTEQTLQNILENNYNTELNKEIEPETNSIISLTNFLLIALHRFIPDLASEDYTYKSDKLLAHFNNYFNFNQSKDDTSNQLIEFIQFVEKQFNIFDKFIIKLDKDDGYRLEKIDDKEYLSTKKNMLRVFQSYLYVSNFNNQSRWLIPALDFLMDKNLAAFGNDSDIASFIDNLKIIDNAKAIKIDTANFGYGSINRYWFWRLDYYIWETFTLNFEKKTKTNVESQNHTYNTEYKDIIKNFIFRNNRSIEHIAPQNPLRNTNAAISSELMNTFGNLCMISNQENSSLRNETFEVKKAYVDSFIKKERLNTISSLKMLAIYNNSTWNDVNLKLHHDKMIGILINSFKTSINVNYENIIDALEEKKYHA